MEKAIKVDDQVTYEGQTFKVIREAANATVYVKDEKGTEFRIKKAVLTLVPPLKP